MTNFPKHISFDFWNTIGSPNGVYAEARTDALLARFSTTGDHARSVYTKVKTDLDLVAETTGATFSHREIMQKLFRAFGVEPSPRDIVDLSDTFNQLFVKYPPRVSAALVSSMKRAQAMGITMSIGSNTNFINGSIIQRTIPEVLPLLDFCVFSDVHQVAKPERAFFQIIHSMISAKRNINVTDITHIGDNQICDIQGAESFGMMARLVRNADHTADVLNDLLTRMETV